MARRIQWTEQAQICLIEITNFWNEHNASDSFSKKLSTEIFDKLLLIASNPLLGLVEQESGFRKSLVHGFYVYYDFDDSHIEVLFVWDCRRNPVGLRKILGLDS